MKQLLDVWRRQLRWGLVILTALPLGIEVLRSPAPAQAIIPAVLRALILGAVGFLGGYAILAFQAHNRFAPRPFVRSAVGLLVAFFSVGAAAFTLNAAFRPGSSQLVGAAVACSAGVAMGGIGVWAKHFAAEGEQDGARAGNLSQR